MVATCTRTDRPLHFRMGLDAILDPADDPPEYASVEDLTQWYNDMLAARIHQQPEQYWWLHDRWKDLKPRRRRKKKVTAAA
jgi:KDO2-lipid IV(A) lauroyltransferase